jgi:tRNA uridine 5-carboxymethylaminomethyl modification enzyme
LPASDRLNYLLAARGTSPVRESALLIDLLRRPELEYADIVQLSPPPEPRGAHAAERVESETKYAGYIERQADEVQRMKRMESHVIPADFDYSTEATPLSMEARQKLADVTPRTLGQASRISGVSPADISALMVLLHGRGAGKTQDA